MKEFRSYIHISMFYLVQVLDPFQFATSNVQFIDLFEVLGTGLRFLYRNIHTLVLTL